MQYARRNKGNRITLHVVLYHRNICQVTQSCWTICTYKTAAWKGGGGNTLPPPKYVSRLVNEFSPKYWARPGSIKPSHAMGRLQDCTIMKYHLISLSGEHKIVFRNYSMKSSSSTPLLCPSPCHTVHRAWGFLLGYVISRPTDVS